MEKPDLEKTSRHSPLKISLIVLTVVIYVLELAVNGISGGYGKQMGWFLHDMEELSDYYNLEITPAGFTFSIWGFIFAWQLIWMIYVLTTICRKIKDGRYIYQLPLLPPLFYAVFIINSLLVTSWLFVWDRQQLIAACVVLALCVFTAYVCVGITFVRLHKNLDILIKQEATKEIWFIRFFVQNGIAFYAAWVAVATLLNFSIVLRHVANVDLTTACTISLSILTVELVAWFVLDNFVFDKYSRYTFSPYLTVVWAFIGAVLKNYDLVNTKTNSIFLLVLLIVSVIMLVLKMFFLFWRHFRGPLRSTSYKPTV